jgi:hypothetical protein
MTDLEYLEVLAEKARRKQHDREEEDSRKQAEIDRRREKESEAARKRDKDVEGRSKSAGRKKKDAERRKKKTTSDSPDFVIGGGESHEFKDEVYGNFQEGSEEEKEGQEEG